MITFSRGDNNPVLSTDSDTCSPSVGGRRERQAASISRFWLRALPTLCCIFFTQADCIAAPRSVRSLLEIRQQYVVIQHFDLSCGAAALATLLRFQHGERVTEREVATGLMQRDVYLADPDLIRQHEGFSLLDLKRYLQSRGYDGLGYGGLTLDDLMQHVPMMVPVNLHGYPHFVIVRGRVGNLVMLADPAWGNRTMPVDEFVHLWRSDPQNSGIGFVVQRRADAASDPPVENRLAPRAEDGLLLN